MANLFCGTFEHQLDDKNRLRIPAKFRKALVGEHGEKTYSFARGMNGCIYVLPDEVLEEMMDELSKEKLGEATQASLLVFSNVFPAEEDAQGRVTVPLRLKNAVKMGKDVVTVGRGRRLEIWPLETYNKYLENADYDSMFKTLGI
jgi:MraZ protein